MGNAVTDLAWLAALLSAATTGCTSSDAAQPPPDAASAGDVSADSEQVPRRADANDGEPVGESEAESPDQTGNVDAERRDASVADSADMTTDAPAADDVLARDAEARVNDVVEPRSTVNDCFVQLSADVMAPSDEVRGDCGPNPVGSLAYSSGLPVPEAVYEDAQAASPRILWCSSPNDIWGTDFVPPTDVVPVVHGRLLHWDGATWTALTREVNVYPQNRYPESAWGRSSDDVWFANILGRRSVDHFLEVLHWNGVELQTLRLLPRVSNTAFGGELTLRTWSAKVAPNDQGIVQIFSRPGDIYSRLAIAVKNPLLPDCLSPLY